MDALVLARARAGDEAAFVAMYEYFSPPIHRFAYRLLGSHSHRRTDVNQSSNFSASRDVPD